MRHGSDHRRRTISRLENSSDRRNRPLNRSLSVLLPVHNVQSSLSARVNETLEVLAELTDRFELVILDDGSTDATCEVGSELSQRYPQVRLLRDSVRRGAVSAVRQGIGQVNGEAVVVHDGGERIEPKEIASLWRSEISPMPAPKWSRSNQAPNSARRNQGFYLLRSGAVESRSTAKDAAPANSRNQSSTGSTPAQSAAGPRIESAAGPTKRPNFLAKVTGRVREFTRGE